MDGGDNQFAVFFLPLCRLRPSRHASGRVTGVIERVRTGEKQRFDGLDGLGTAMGRMVAGTQAPADADDAASRKGDQE